jgi:trehalose 6-phosphate synthase/phosphatase
VVSGRGRPVLERWLGATGIGLHAEHGLWSRLPGEAAWTGLEVSHDTQWRPRVRGILEQVAARTPGSLVEEKDLSLAFHFRAADSEFGQRQANELRLHLNEMLSNVPVEILVGNKVIEVRPHGVHKGRMMRRVANGAAPGSLIVALGDDRTDEDMFTSLPPGSMAVHIGPTPSVAPIRLASPTDARAFLARLRDPSA